MTTKSKGKKKPTQKQLANAAMRSYIKATAEKVTASERQKLAKTSLIAFAALNKDMAGEDGNIQLSGGDIHFGEETVIRPCEGFIMSKFVQDYPELVDQKFKTAPIKNALSDEAARQKLLANHCVDIKKEDTIDIIIDKKS